MVHVALMLTAILGLAAAVSPAGAESKVCPPGTKIWDDPGRNPFVGDFAEHIRKMPATPKNRETLTKLVADAVITRSELGKFIEDSRLLPGEKARWLREFEKDKQKFYLREDLQIRGLPDEVFELINKVKVKPVEIHFQPGSKFDYMAWGDGKVWRNVCYDPGPGVRERVHPVHRKDIELKALVFTAEDKEKGAVIVIPTVCRNLAFKEGVIGLLAEHELPPRAPTTTRPQPGLAEVAPKPGAPGRSAGTPAALYSGPLPKEGSTIVLHLWDSASAKSGNPVTMPTTNVVGRQSSDLGSMIRRSAARGELKPAPNDPKTGMPYQFTVHFLGVDYRKARGTRITVNGKETVIPEDFGPDKNWIAVPVTNGEGVLTFGGGDWMDQKKLKIIAKSPWGHSGLPYPKSGQLVTCTAAEMESRNPDWCPKPDLEKNPQGRSELAYRLADEPPIIHLHYAK